MIVKFHIFARFRVQGIDLIGKICIDTDPIQTFRKPTFKLSDIYFSSYTLY